MILKKNKLIKPNNNITYFLNPDYIYVAYNKIYVKKNDYVYKGQAVSDTGYSSVSGKVLGIKKKKYLVIENDYREYIKEDKVVRDITIENILRLLKNDKLFSKFKSSIVFDNIVLYAINDNPYVYNEVFLLKENIHDILEFFNKLLVLYNCSNNLLVVKNTDAFVINECLNIIGSYPEINLSLVQDEYLLENNEYLMKYLKLNGNTLFLSISDIIYIYNLFKGKISTTQLITISGDAILESKVIRVKTNTLLSDVINRFIDITCDYECIVNGLLTGRKIDNINEFVITSNIVSVNLCKIKERVVNDCILCGKCVSICPVGVNMIDLSNKSKCISCGLCSYVCPCNINLRERINKQ